MEESKPSLRSMKALSVPYRYEYISLDFDTMYKLITASFSFCLQHNSVLVTFPGHKSFCSCFGCGVTVCSVRYNVLLGMDFFFQVKLLLHFHLFRNIPISLF